MISESDKIMEKFNILDTVTLDSKAEHPGMTMDEIIEKRILKNDAVKAVYISTPDVEHHTEAIGTTINIANVFLNLNSSMPESWERCVCRKASIRIHLRDAAGAGQHENSARRFPPSLRVRIHPR